eukprot:7557998-Pyramimonas_sp.AAC.1
MSKMSKWFKRFSLLSKKDDKSNRRDSNDSRSSSFPGLLSKQEVLEAKRQSSNKSTTLQALQGGFHGASCPQLGDWKREEGVDPKVAPDPSVVDFCYDLVEEMVNRATSRQKNDFCVDPARWVKTPRTQRDTPPNPP